MSLDNSHYNQLRYLTFRALKSRYAGTTLGTIWAFALPLMQITVYVVVFGFLFKSKLPGSETSLTYVIWFLLGYSPWMLVSECLPGSASCMQANAGLIKSFPLKKPIIVYSVVLAALPQLALCLLISGLLILFTGEELGPLILSYQGLGLCGLILIVINSELINDCSLIKWLLVRLKAAIWVIFFPIVYFLWAAIIYDFDLILATINILHHPCILNLLE